MASIAKVTFLYQVSVPELDGMEHFETTVILRLFLSKI